MPERLPGQILILPAKGAALFSERDATDIIADAKAAHARVAAIPVARFEPAFFDLSTGLAGAFLQKFAASKVRVAILGDLSEQTAASTALADFVRESNAGGEVWFLADMKALIARLARR